MTNSPTGTSTVPDQRPARCTAPATGRLQASSCASFRYAGESKPYAHVVLSFHPQRHLWYDAIDSSFEPWKQPLLMVTTMCSAGAPAPGKTYAFPATDPTRLGPVSETMRFALPTRLAIGSVGAGRGEAA